MEWKNEIKAGTLARVLERMKGIDPKSTLTVHLQNNEKISGTPIKCDNENHMLVLEVRTTPPAELTYIPFSSISHLHVTNAVASLPALTEQAIARNPGEEALSLFQLKRIQGENFKDIIPKVTIEWPENMETIGRLNFKDLIDALPVVLTDIRNDKLGAEALRNLQLIKIVTAAGEFLAAKKIGSDLVITLDPVKALPKDLKVGLKDILENAL